MTSPVSPLNARLGGSLGSEKFRSPPVSPVISSYKPSSRSESFRTPPVSPVVGRKVLPPIQSPRSTMSPTSVITSSPSSSSSRRRAKSWNSDKSIDESSPKSIERKLASIKTPTAKHYNLLGNAYFRQGNLNSAATCYKTATTLTGSATDRAAALMNLGTVCWKSGNTDSAIHFLELAKADENIADSVQHQLGVCYALTGDYDRAVFCLEKAKEIRSAKFGASSPKVAQTVDEIGKIFLMKGEDFYEVAMKCHQQALMLLKVSGHCTGATLLNMAKIHRLTHNYSTALSILQQVALLNTSKAVQVQTLQLMADVYECMGKSQKALEVRELGRRRAQSN